MRSLGVWIPFRRALGDGSERGHAVGLGPDERRAALPVVGQPLLEGQDQRPVFLLVFGQVHHRQEVVVDGSRLVVDRDRLSADLVEDLDRFELGGRVPPTVEVIGVLINIGQFHGHVGEQLPAQAEGQLTAEAVLDVGIDGHALGGVPGPEGDVVGPVSQL